jgi:hypothetical protein
MPTPRLCGEVPGPYRIHPLEAAGLAERFLRGDLGGDDRATRLAEEAARLLRSLARPAGGARARRAAAKRDWGGSGDPTPSSWIRRDGEILEHNVGDLTAVQQAGVPLAKAQAAFAEEGQMLALDPPLGTADARRRGAWSRTNDSGPPAPPLRARARPRRRDLARALRRLAREGRRQGDQERRGYDLAKLFTGSYGTLGLIVDGRPCGCIPSRRHRHRVSARATTRPARPPPRRSSRALPLEADSLDAAWQQGSGRLLARFGGATAADQAEATASGCARPASTACRPSRTTRTCGRLRAAQRRPGRVAEGLRPRDRPRARLARTERRAARSSRAPRTGCRGSRSTPGDLAAARPPSATRSTRARSCCSTAPADCGAARPVGGRLERRAPSAHDAAGQVSASTQAQCFSSRRFEGGI